MVSVGPTIFLGFLYPKLQRIGPWQRVPASSRTSVDALLYARSRRVARRPISPNATDVLSRLLVADPTQTDDELRDHLVTLLLAGHETTAATLAWTLHDLARRPQLLARVQPARSTTDDAAYLDATVKEAMRLRPVIRNVARRLNRPARVGGYDLPAGVVVFPSIYLVQHRPDRVPGARRVPPGTLPRRQPAAGHLDPVRRRAASLPGCRAGHGGGHRRCSPRCCVRWTSPRSGARSGRAPATSPPSPARGARLVILPR